MSESFPSRPIANIPGFWFDVTKKKYFRIQENHVAPTGSQYSIESVSNDERAKKKRRLDQQKAERIATQTICRSSLLTSPFARLKLLCEIGNLTNYESRHFSSVTVAACLVAQVPDAETSRNARLPSGKHLIVSDFDYLNGVFYLGYDDEQRTIFFEQELYYPGPRFKVLEHVPPLPSSMLTLDISRQGVLIASAIDTSKPNVVIANTQSDINAHMMYRCGDRFHQITKAVRPSPDYDKLFIMLNDEDDSSSLFRQIDLNLASGNNRSMRKINLISDTGPIRGKCLDWLNERTVTIASADRNIYLYDIRSDGLSARFTHSTAQFRDIKSSDSGNSICVSTPGGISLYDVRMPSRLLPSSSSTSTSDAVFDISFGNELASGPLCLLSRGRSNILGRDLVAAPDITNSIRLYSTLDGSLVRKLPPPEQSLSDRGYIRRLRTFEDRHGGVCLSYCLGAEIRTWGFGGVDWSIEGPDEI